MEVFEVLEGDILEIRICGEVDARSSLQLDEVVRNAIGNKHKKIMVNCKELQYISSAGLGVFISNHDDLKSFGGKFVFYDMIPAVYNIFEILGLHAIMEIVENRTEAQMLVNEG